MLQAYVSCVKAVDAWAIVDLRLASKYSQRGSESRYGTAQAVYSVQCRLVQVQSLKCCARALPQLPNPLGLNQP